jgi:UDP-N-acetylglucosamine--N-acetylmuramyl-(pentapeptide) pyrophosphoryl-undecaprenol N-acetylglucosamine transferase
MKKIVLAGGGTGGHIFPLIAVARQIKAFDEEVKLIFIGPKTEFENIFLEGEGFEIKNILSGKIRRYFSLQNFIDIIKIPIGILQAFIYLFFEAPDIIFSKGGYGSFPTIIAGWFLRIPIIIHESDAVPGLTNRILAKFAKRILVSFPKTPYFSVKKMLLVGNPIRLEILNGKRDEAIQQFKLHNDRPILLVIGGSQGAQRINEKILSMLSQLLEKFEIIHQVGENNYRNFKKEIEANFPAESLQFYHVYPFLKEKEMANAYAVSDLIISRAGSGSIFEIAAVGKPSILIPLPEAAQNHQVENAYRYAQTGAAIVIEEKNFTPHLFLGKLKWLFNHPEELEKMSQAAKKFAKIDAAKKIAKIILTEI